MTVSMPKHGRKYKGFVLLDRDQAEYVERKAEQDRLNNSLVIRRAIDLLMRLEPLKDEQLAS